MLAMVSVKQGPVTCVLYLSPVFLGQIPLIALSSAFSSQAWIDLNQLIFKSPTLHWSSQNWEEDYFKATFFPIDLGQVKISWRVVHNATSFHYENMASLEAYSLFPWVWLNCMRDKQTANRLLRKGYFLALDISCSWLEVECFPPSP